MRQRYPLFAAPVRPTSTTVRRTTAPAPLRSCALAMVPCAVLALCAPPWVLAQSLPSVPAGTTPTQSLTPLPITPDSSALRLRSSPQLQETTPEDTVRQQPSFVTGDRITGRPDLETIIEGNAELRRSDAVIRADRIEYNQPTDVVKARGNVRINKDGNTYSGSEGQIKLDSVEGYLDNTEYQFLRNGAYGQAERFEFTDANRSLARQATYSSCTRRPGPSWMPDWVLKAAQVNFDTETQTGEATDVQLRFYDVPILALPSLSFPLSDARKSGWLPPTFNTDTVSGVDLSVPYYWNIAPNRDATIYTSVMSKRGINIGTEFRYRETDYNGLARYDLLPADRLRAATRWGLTTSHTGILRNPIAPIGDVALGLSVNRVSDADYWRDFPRASSSLTQRLLATDGTLAWARGPFSLNARALKWQTLQVAGAVITPPYDRLPQFTARFTQNNWAAAGGMDVSAELDTTRFRADRALTLQPNGRRTYLQAQLSKPWASPAYFFTPKLQLHGTDYRLDSPLADGTTQAQRTVPTASLDSGLIFERDASYFGRSFTQTLEPRALYVYTPFRNQAALPNYDSGANDFNFASIYGTNSFVGNDRIADDNLLTLGVTSRLLDPDTGAEAVRVAYAQRLRFADQNVSLPGGSPDTARFSDMLFGANVNWSPKWSTEAVVQYNPKTRESERSTLGVRFNPGNYRTFSAAYRFTRSQNEQVDLGWQWPLNDLWGDKGKDLGVGQGQGEGRWYSVGRLNYNLKDRKIVDTVIGFEYDAGCWLGRVVFDRIQTTATSANKRISFQLEFVGFTRLGVGTNPLKTLKDNVPSYQYLREKITTSPSRFSNYD